MERVFKKRRNRIVHLDYSGRTNNSDGPIRALSYGPSSVSTNQSSSYGPSSVSINQILQTDLPTDHLPYQPIRSFGRIFLRTIFGIDQSSFRIGQSDPSDGLSYGHLSVSANHILRTDLPTDIFPYWPIRSFGQTFLRTSVRIGQSYPFDGLSYGPSLRIGQSDPPDRLSYGHLSISANQILRTDFPTDYLFVSANNILWTDLPTDHLSALANQILRTDLSKDHLPYRPIRSLRVSSAETPKISSHSNGHGTHDLTRARSPSLNPTLYSNNLRSHEREGQNLKKKSPQAKVVLSCTH